MKRAPVLTALLLRLLALAAVRVMTFAVARAQQTSAPTFGRF